MEKLDELLAIAKIFVNHEVSPMTVEPEDVIDVCEAFRALEQRAEAAEAKAKNLNDGWLNAIAERDEARTEQGKLAAARSVRDNWKERAWAAEEKLAELEKQKAVGTVSIAMDWNTHRNIATVNMRPDLVVAEMKDGDELFTRPAPAVSMADLVPDEKAFFKPEFGTDPYAKGRVDGFNLCRAAILRNIEEAK